MSKLNKAILSQICLLKAQVFWPHEQLRLQNFKTSLTAQTLTCKAPPTSLIQEAVLDSRTAQPTSMSLSHFSYSTTNFQT